jgi:hypothetical protein
MVIADLKDVARNPLKLAWEGFVGGVTRLLRNQPRNRFATQIPISGDFDAPRAAILPTLGNLFKNEFIRAYDADLEGTIDFGDAQRAAAAGGKAAEKQERAEEKQRIAEEKAREKAERKAEKEQEKRQRDAAKGDEKPILPFLPR